MLVGVPKEIKNHEYRVGLTPDSVREVVAHGHEVVVETNAGVGIGASDADYEAAGASILPTAAEVFAKAEMIVKVKEPQAVERKMLRPDHLLFTYLHLAPDPEQTADLVASGAVCIAYETVTDQKGRLPLLAPMSQVAGRLSIQAGATALQKANGGAGVLLGGVPGVAPAKTVVIGGGVVGAHAIEMAIGLGSDVTVLDRNVDVLDALSARFGSRLKTVFSNRAALEKEVLAADLVVGAVLVAGAAAPKLVTKEHIKAMKPGSVVVDVAIDQGGCFETSRATTHQDPTYIVDEVVHYCVANMPGAVARTSTYALNNATLPYVLALADKGYAAALRDIPGFMPGLNVYKGQVTVAEVAENLGYTYVSPEAALAQETEAA
ncbi:Alanine dehydrogenase and pyridine nucleotide transhydrogenase [Pseudovibrio sp. FO-BEG1]|uniref:Alanine dehydrogenase n=1 Tax=Pseudovibrio denitrificans TaxID=258256 RepID=A0A1I6ZK59_9HYPH|nr:MULTISPECIES: alanine dehydrogenase [Pseudovibrio]AEV38656.1 Alanine dehydrogenase and pyridine nucleotide transhydrogenase [Pseudovibrio sp. FO-BEG1]SFT63045.1 L-alanine dehydrogenase [Pseudovibrio denitrificans]